MLKKNVKCLNSNTSRQVPLFLWLFPKGSNVVYKQFSLKRLIYFRSDSILALAIFFQWDPEDHDVLTAICKSSSGDGVQTHISYGDQCRNWLTKTFRTSVRLTFSFPDRRTYKFCSWLTLPTRSIIGWPTRYYLVDMFVTY